VRVERSREDGGQNAAGDGAADALHAAAHGSGDVRLQDDERGHQQPVSVIDMQKQDDDHVETADQGYARGVAQRQRLEREAGAQLVEDAGGIPALAQFGEARVNVAKLADGLAGRSWDRCNQLQGGRCAEAEECGAFNGCFKQRSSLGDLSEKEAGRCIGLV